MIKGILISALAMLVAGPAAASDITGVWLAHSRSAHIELSKCGEAICGKILSATPAKTNPELLDVHNKNPALRTRKMVGQLFIEGFTGGPVKWTGGRLYNPDDGNFYRGVITLVDDNHIQLKGCAIVFLCRSQVLTRLQ